MNPFKMDLRTFFQTKTPAKTETEPVMGSETKTETKKTKTETKKTKKEMLQWSLNDLLQRNPPMTARAIAKHMDEEKHLINQVLYAHPYQFKHEGKDKNAPLWTVVKKPETDRCRTCEVCEQLRDEEDMAGCCRNGECHRRVENMCMKCGQWDEEEEVWRCPSCCDSSEEEE